VSTDDAAVTIPAGAPAPDPPRPPMAALLRAVTDPRSRIDLAGCTDPARAHQLEPHVVAGLLAAAHRLGCAATTVTLQLTPTDGSPPRQHQLVRVGRQLLTLTAAQFQTDLGAPLPVAYVLDVADLDDYTTLVAARLDVAVTLAGPDTATGQPAA
jgi:hypothetical protein